MRRDATQLAMIAGELATAPHPAFVEAPRTLEKALGLQVRALRKERDLSVAELASAAGISIGMLSKIENGQISPSLSTIQAIASALNTAFTSLFAAFEDRRDCSHVEKDQAPVIERRGSKAGHVYKLLGAVLAQDPTVEPYLVTLDENAETYTGFRHVGVEFLYMLGGAMVYRHADRLFRLNPGDSLLFDSGSLHGPEQLLALPATFLSVLVGPGERA